MKEKLLASSGGKLRMERASRKRKQVETTLNAKKNVRNANKLEDPLSLLSSNITYEKDGLAYHFECEQLPNIDSDTLDWILDLEKRNMRTLYENSDWGWNFQEKIKEMTNRKAWYLIAKSPTNLKVGFSHFRFDMDHGCAVLYCYEIQLEESVRGLGLGKHLMKLLELISFTYKMEKVVLTVFKHNKSAYKFFTSLGYCTDVTSPEDNDENKYCYVILSKSDKPERMHH